MSQTCRTGIHPGLDLLYILDADFYSDFGLSSCPVADSLMVEVTGFGFGTSLWSWTPNILSCRTERTSCLMKAPSSQNTGRVTSFCQCFVNNVSTKSYSDPSGVISVTCFIWKTVDVLSFSVIFKCKKSL